MSPDDYGGVIGQLIQFHTRDTKQMHTIIITHDLLCEDDPNEFFSNIAFVSGTQPIEVIHPQARVIIYDSMEPECGKQGLFSMNNNSGSTHLSLVPLIFRMEATQKAPKQSACVNYFIRMRISVDCTAPPLIHHVP